MAIRGGCDPEALLRAHFEAEIEEERRRGPPRPDRPSGLPVLQRRPRTRTWVGEAVAAALLVLSVGGASAGFAVKSPAAALADRALESGALSRCGVALSDAFVDLIKAYGDPRGAGVNFGRFHRKE
jgi:hypothetical protein